MSYSDKEKQMGYQSDDKMSSKEKFNNHPETSKKEATEVDDILPVGQLKWRKDEEEEQDTRQSLEVAKETDQPNKEGEIEAKEEVQEKKQDPIEPEQPFNEQKTPPASGVDQHSPREGRQLSLEDTLTPIDFKEYSIDPVIEEKNNDETFKQEVKKPSFVAKQPADAPDAPSFAKETAGAYNRDEDARFSDEKKEQIRKWVKILWLPVSLIVSLYVGFVIGHTIIGDQPAGDIFNIDMWVHIYQLMFGS